MGPSGVTIVVVKGDLISNNLRLEATPSMMDWELALKNDSMYNTPPCYAIYMCGLYFDYLKQKGGIQWTSECSDIKSKLVYDCIDSSNGFYNNPVRQAYRSRTNIPFIMESDKMLDNFLGEAK